MIYEQTVVIKVEKSLFLTVCVFISVQSLGDNLQLANSRRLYEYIS